jgi:hypothetical protein
LWADTKFQREFGALITTAPRADAQVVALICGHLDEREASRRQSGVRPQKGSPHGFAVKRITVNHAVEKALDGN